MIRWNRLPSLVEIVMTIGGKANENDRRDDTDIDADTDIDIYIDPDTNIDAHIDIEAED